MSSGRPRTARRAVARRDRPSRGESQWEWFPAITGRCVTNVSGPRLPPSSPSGPPQAASEPVPRRLRARRTTDSTRPSRPAAVAALGLAGPGGRRRARCPGRCRVPTPRVRHRQPTSTRSRSTRSAWPTRVCCRCRPTQLLRHREKAQGVGREPFRASPSDSAAGQLAPQAGTVRGPAFEGLVRAPCAFSRCRGSWVGRTATAHPRRPGAARRSRPGCSSVAGVGLAELVLRQRLDNEHATTARPASPSAATAAGRDGAWNRRATGAGVGAGAGSEAAWGPGR